MNRREALRAALGAAWKVWRTRSTTDAGGANQASTTTVTAEKQAAASTPPANPFQREDEQYLTAIKWLIGALAAIAAVLVAGIQLSTLGELRWPEDRPRLLLAAGAFTLVLICVVLALGLLAWVHMPEKGSDLDRLHEIARKGAPDGVLEAVRRDSSYHRGTGELASLLTALDRASNSFYQARRALTAARLTAAGAQPTGTGKAVSVEQANAQVEEWSESYGRLREGARRVSQLDRHLRIAQRARGVLTGVLLLTLLSALSLGAFSWAAHPPDRAASPQEAVPARPVSALLLLSDDDPVWADRLGAGCAQAARDGGVPVVALSSSDEAVEVLVLEGGECAAPRVVLVPTDAGTVEAVDQVTTGSG